MKLSTTTRAAGLTLALATTLVLSACGASNEDTDAGSDAGASGSGSSSAPELSGTLNGAGSSAQQAAMQAWTAGFNASQPGVTVNYDPVGSGGGRTQFIAGGVDFAGSDSPLKDDELTQANTACGTDGVFELPDYISAIAVIYNLDGVDDLQLSPATLAGIFKGTITTWDDAAIKADNPDADLPSSTITPVHRGDKSGTTSNFTDYLSKAAPEVWTDPSGDTWPTSTGEAANQTSGMVEAVKAGSGSIGYADESQAGDLGIAKVKVGEDFVAPSPEAAAKVVEGSTVQTGRAPYDYAYSINRTTTSSDEYPIVLVSYHIGCVASKQADVLKGFLSYVVSEDGQKAAASQAGSSPISDSLREQAVTAIDAIKASA